MNWYLKAFKSYATFTGRARRKEYWMFSLFNLIFIIVAFLLDMMLGTMMVIYGLYLLASLLPSLAVTVRRLHDTGKSGWFILLGLIPIVGAIIVLVFMCMDSQPGDNKWGPNPKAGEAVIA